MSQNDEPRHKGHNGVCSVLAFYYYPGSDPFIRMVFVLNPINTNPMSYTARYQALPNAKIVAKKFVTKEPIINPELVDILLETFMNGKSGVFVV